MRIKIERRSPAYYRMMQAGFKIININLIKLSHNLYEPIIRIKCICGTVERLVGPGYTCITREELPCKWDIAQLVEDSGGVSVEHLQEDGYSEKEIKFIRRAYN